MIEFDDFARVDMRVGRIVAAEPFPEARKPSYQLRIDFGPEIGELMSSAQLTVTYPDRADLVGRQVVAVVNFPPRRIAGFASQVLVLGAMGDTGDVWLLGPDPEAPLGSRIG
ncbi:MAG TPA: tRNA-binding protein [Candidatus Limnocylindria bacterium]|nr:tRNA-binding protein [Candidatus Limnocylindria bacterium]